MPQRSWGAKRERQYEHIKESLEKEGRSEHVAEEIAARTVNKERARHGESKEASKTSTEDSRRVAAVVSAPTRDRAGARTSSSMPKPSAAVSRDART